MSKTVRLAVGTPRRSRSRVKVKKVKVKKVKVKKACYHGDPWGRFEQELLVFLR